MYLISLLIQVTTKFLTLQHLSEDIVFVLLRLLLSQSLVLTLVRTDVLVKVI